MAKISVWIVLLVGLIPLLSGQIGEFRGGLNIALKKPTRQFPYDFCKDCRQWLRTCGNCATSDRAVDGNADPDTMNEHCSHTEDYIKNRVASWSVDLQGLYYISSIKITNRLDVNNCCRGRLKGFSIRGYPDNVLIYEDINNSYLQDVINVTMPYRFRNRKFSNITILSPPHNGRYSYGTAKLTLCEVEIYADQALNCNVPTINHGIVSIKDDGALSVQTSSAKMLTWLVNVETTLTISCENGYALTGNREISCDRYGRWTEATPTCTDIRLGQGSGQGHIPIFDGNQRTQARKVITCPPPKVVTNGHYFQLLDNGKEIEIRNNTDMQYHLNETLRLYCIGGLVQRNYSKRSCLGNGTWSGYEPICKVITCPHPKALTNGHYFQLLDNGTEIEIRNSTGMKYHLNATLRVYCKEGLVQRSYSERSCLRNGTWSGSEPICKVITCPRPKAVTNGHYFQLLDNGTEVEIMPNTNTKYHLNATLRVICIEGLDQHSYSERSCQGDGTWSGSEPICKVITCPHPKVVTNGHYFQLLDNGTEVEFTHSTDTKYHLNATLRLYCKEGFNYSEWSCQGNGTWSGSKPICKDKVRHCIIPRIDHGLISIKPDAVLSEHPSTERTYTGVVYVESALTISCEKGYVLSGSSEINCNGNGQWNEDIPTCTAITCPHPKALTNGHYFLLLDNDTEVEITHNTAMKYHLNATLSAYCIKGFVQRNYSERSCLENGSWSGPEPVCKAEDTPTFELLKMVLIGLGAFVTIVLVVTVLVMVVRKCKRHKEDTAQTYEPQLSFVCDENRSYCKIGTSKPNVTDNKEKA